MAGNKNIPRLTEALAPEVFEFYIRHQEEIDKNIQHFFADQPDRYDEYLEYDSGKDRPLIGNPIAVNFSSFTYRPPTLADTTPAPDGQQPDCLHQQHFGRRIRAAQTTVDCQQIRLRIRPI